MTEQNKLEDFSSQPPLHIDRHLSINIPDFGFVDSDIAPTPGYPPSVNIPDTVSVDSDTAPTHGYPPSINIPDSGSVDSATAPTHGYPPSINISDSGSVDSATAPTHGYPPSINIPDSGFVDSATAPTHGYLPGHQTFIIKTDSATAPTQGSNVDVGEQKRLGFFGYGFGWDLFILGFFLLAIPWFVGAVIFLLMICFKADMRGKYGYAACFIGSMVISIVLDSIQRETCTDCLSEGVNFS